MCFSYVFDELCCFYAAAMLLVLLCGEELYRGKKPPEDGCMEPKHVVEEEQEI
jgi:hypothetical protein